MTRNDGAAWYFSIEQQVVNGVLVLFASGRISHRASRQLSRELTAAVTGKSGVVVDLSGVDYISSAGLRSFEAAGAQLARTQRELVVCGLQETIRPAFALRGVIPHVAIESTREIAIHRSMKSGLLARPPE